MNTKSHRTDLRSSPLRALMPALYARATSMYITSMSTGCLVRPSTAVFTYVNDVRTTPGHAEHTSYTQAWTLVSEKAHLQPRPELGRLQPKDMRIDHAEPGTLTPPAETAFAPHPTSAATGRVLDPLPCRRRDMRGSYMNRRRNEANDGVGSEHNGQHR